MNFLTNQNSIRIFIICSPASKSSKTQPIMVLLIKGFNYLANRHSLFKDMILSKHTDCLQPQVSFTLSYSLNLTVAPTMSQIKLKPGFPSRLSTISLPLPRKLLVSPSPNGCLPFPLPGIFSSLHYLASSPSPFRMETYTPFPSLGSLLHPLQQGLHLLPASLL